jgi:multidrug efflux pump subunit AcrA (membrane-fusion protein)
VLRIEPVADAVTEEVLAKVDFDASASLPPIGELAEVTVALPSQKKALALPNAAIHRIDGELGVWAIRDGDPEFVVVRLGAEDAEGWVQVLEGLAKGERVVLHSARPLGSSSRLSIIDKLP